MTWNPKKRMQDERMDEVRAELDAKFEAFKSQTQSEMAAQNQRNLASRGLEIVTEAGVNLAGQVGYKIGALHQNLRGALESSWKQVGFEELPRALVANRDILGQKLSAGANWVRNTVLPQNKAPRRNSVPGGKKTASISTSLTELFDESQTTTILETTVECPKSSQSLTSSPVNEKQYSVAAYEPKLPTEVASRPGLFTSPTTFFFLLISAIIAGVGGRFINKGKK